MSASGLGTRRSRVFWLILFSVCAAVIPSAQIVIKNDDLQPDEVARTAPLVGYRLFSTDAIVRSDDGDKIGIPVPLYVDAAKRLPSLRAGVEKHGKNIDTATVRDWLNAALEISPTQSTVPNEVQTYIMVPGKDRKPRSGDMALDASLIATLPGTEVCGNNRNRVELFNAAYDGRRVQAIACDPKAMKGMVSAYDRLYGARFRSDRDAQSAYVMTDSAFSAYHHLAGAVRFSAGQVTFGKIVSHSASEWQLQVPDSIARDYDIYGLEFAVSFRDLDQPFEKLIFSASAPDDSIALELVPLRYDKIINETLRKTTKAEATATAGGNTVTIGKSFEQEIAFQDPIPTLIADGLRESSFSWTMTDNAVQPGSKKFVAIVGVPHGRARLELKISASARTKDTWYAQGDIVSTDSGAQLVRLK